MVSELEGFTKLSPYWLKSSCAKTLNPVRVAIRLPELT